MFKKKRNGSILNQPDSITAGSASIMAPSSGSLLSGHSSILGLTGAAILSSPSVPSATGGPFDPGAFGNVFIDMRADVAGSITAAANEVSAWNSSYTGTVTRTFTQPGNKPAYSGTGLNGRPTIFFNGNASVSDWLQYANSASDMTFMGDGNGATVYIVTSINAVATRNIFGNNAGTAPPGMSLFCNPTNHNLVATLSNSSAPISVISANAVYSETIPVVLTLRSGLVGSNDFEMFMNGTSVAGGAKTGAYGTPATGLLNLGSATNHAANMEGNISQVLIYRVAQSNSTVASVANALKTIWGIA